MKDSIKYSLIGASAVTLAVSAVGFYMCREIDVLYSSIKEKAERRKEEIEPQRAEAKGKLEECLAFHNSDGCNQLSLRYNRLNETYTVSEKFSQKADEGLRNKNILLVEFTVTSALGILGMVYGFRRKEEENQAKDGQ